MMDKNYRITYSNTANTIALNIIAELPGLAQASIWPNLIRLTTWAKPSESVLS